MRLFLLASFFTLFLASPMVSALRESPGSADAQMRSIYHTKRSEVSRDAVEHLSTRSSSEDEQATAEHGLVLTRDCGDILDQQKQNSIKEAISKVKGKSSTGTSMKEMLDHFAATHYQNTGPGSSQASSGSKYTGKVTQLSKSGPPYREGKKSSAAGPPSTSGRD